MRVQYFILMLCLSTTALNSQMLLDIYATNPCKNFEQSGFTISGQIVDLDSGEPIIFASVALYNADGTLLTGVEADLDGRYSFSNIPKGEYDIEPSFIGYQATRLAGVRVEKDLHDLDIELYEGEISCGLECITFTCPLIRQDETTSGKIISAYDIRPTYSLRTDRWFANNKKRKKRKKARKNKKAANEETTPIAPIEVVKQEVKIEEKSIDIQMYPNPTSGQIYIKASIDIRSINVLNMEGKIIRTIPYTPDNGIDLTPLATGTYYLQFHHDSGVHVEKLVIIEH